MVSRKKLLANLSKARLARRRQLRLGKKLGIRQGKKTTLIPAQTANPLLTKQLRERRFRQIKQKIKPGTARFVVTKTGKKGQITVKRAGTTQAKIPQSLKELRKTRRARFREQVREERFKREIRATRARAVQRAKDIEAARKAARRINLPKRRTAFKKSPGLFGEF